MRRILDIDRQHVAQYFDDGFPFKPFISILRMYIVYSRLDRMIYIQVLYGFTKLHMTYIYIYIYIYDLWSNIVSVAAHIPVLVGKISL